MQILDTVSLIAANVEQVEHPHDQTEYCASGAELFTDKYITCILNRPYISCNSSVLCYYKYIHTIYISQRIAQLHFQHEVLGLFGAEAGRKDPDMYISLKRTAPEAFISAVKNVF